MITETVLITLIICVTVIFSCIVIGHFSNKQAKEQKT